jgi:hypothetical protein
MLDETTLVVSSVDHRRVFARWRASSPGALAGLGCEVADTPLGLLQPGPASLTLAVSHGADTMRAGFVQGRPMPLRDLDNG